MFHSDRLGRYGLPVLITLSVFLLTHCGSIIPAPPETGLENEPVESFPQFEVRSMDGRGNNLRHQSWGSVDTQLLRLADSAYEDGISAPAGSSRPNPREVSNTLIHQDQSIPNQRGLSSFIFAWGQFIDHDIDLTPAGEEPLPIAVPQGDPWFDPTATGLVELPFFRSIFDPESGSSDKNPREQLNRITAFLDASQVYGSGEERANWLRSFTGGKLKVSVGELLPFNDGTRANEPDAATDLFVAGDVRANETVSLTALHTLFVREHNRLCDLMAQENPQLSDEELYQRARRWVGALMQAITFEEFLPALLGPQGPGPYAGYDEGMKPAIFNEFSTALFRVGHTMLPEDLLLTGNGPDAALPLADAFFHPELVQDEGIGPILKGLAFNPIEEIDVHLTSAVRNFLFGPPGSGGLDLASLNLQRGRDHGLADYNRVRKALGLGEIKDFKDLTSRPDWEQAFESLYGDVDDLDLWIAALAEDHLPGSSLGETITEGLLRQFEALRSGDRFWYEHDPAFSEADRAEIRGTRLSDVILRNTQMTGLPEDVFRIP